MKYWLDSLEFRSQITRLVTGSAQQNFGPSHLESISISLPDLAEQKRIAAILERADRLRRLRRYGLKMAESFLPAAFLRLFGDLRTNKKNWGFSELEEVSRIASGVAKGQRYGDRETVSVPYLRVANVQDGFLDLSEI